MKFCVFGKTGNKKNPNRILLSAIVISIPLQVIVQSRGQCKDAVEREDTRYN